MDNADLDKLRISQGRLVPKFNPTVTQYRVTLGSEITEIKLTVITSDSGASTTIKGDASSKVVQLTEGKTSDVEILVTAEDGHSTKTYCLSMHRLSSNDACLSQLDLSTGKLHPSFSPSTFVYYCDLPSNVTQLTMKTKTEDAKMKVTSKSGAPVSMVTLSAGLTPIEILVTSPNGQTTALYTVNALRLRSPYIFQLKTPNPAYLCTVCTNTPHCPCKVSTNRDNVYCRQCLMGLSRVNKVDPLTGGQLGEGWLVLDQEIDQCISEQDAYCNTRFGKVEGKISELSSLISQKSTGNIEEETTSCDACSKKVPSSLMMFHKQSTCSSKLSEPPFKAKVESLFWEKRLINDTLSSKLDDVLAKAKTSEEKYLSLLKDQESSNAADVLEALRQAGACYATAIKIAPQDPRGHVGVGLVMEEMFYIGDMFGMKDIESNENDDESEAEISSKEEEFLAICKLHGVPDTANLAQQLRAVEAEYKALRQAGQGHKAEHVQQLYQWKSKKALQACKGSYAVDTESPLYRARVKYQDAVSVQPTDHAACYHLGRLCLLMGDITLAEKCLKTAASLKPLHSETILCLGLSISSQANAKQHSKALIAHGLTAYMQTQDEVSNGKRSTQLKSLLANEFWRASNTLIGEAFLTLGGLSGHSFLDHVSCYKLAARLFSDSPPNLQKGNTMNQLLWTLIRARAALADEEMKQKSDNASRMCGQVSAIITHCHLPPNEELRTLQMKVFEDGVLMEPTSSVALSRLGSAQLQQYEATSDKIWLDNAEKSYRGSIGCEGKLDNGIDPPDEISGQAWWKKRKEANTAKSTVAAPANKTTTPTSKASTTKAQSKTTTVSKPVQQVSKQSTPTRGGVKQPATSTSRPAGRGIGVKSGTTTGTATKGRGVATLGEIKSGVKKPTGAVQPQQKTPVKTATAEPQPKSEPEKSTSTTSTNSKPGKVNAVSYHPRLGLARVLAKQDNKESIALYNEVIKIAPQVHDAYIELGEILSKTDPVGAVAVYSKFPFTDPPSFDDAYLHGEIVRLLMSSESYDDPQLVTSMISMGKALGIGVLDKNVSILEAKFKTKVLKRVYAGVHGKDIDNPELQAFFKFKCWT